MHQKVSASFDRVGNIKLIPSVWELSEEWRRRVLVFLLGSGGATFFMPMPTIVAKIKKPKRFEVGEILLEDVCICVDAGVWNDLLGDHVGAAFSPEFRLGVKIGPQVSFCEYICKCFFVRLCFGERLQGRMPPYNHMFTLSCLGLFG